MDPADAPLQELVCALTGAASAVVSETVTPLWEGYGRVVRMRLSGHSARHVIVKQVLPPEPPGSPARQRSHARKLRSYDVELAFYRSYAGRCDMRCRVPLAIAAGRGEPGWCFVLEDLDHAGLSERHSSLRRADLARCLAWLAAFHATFLDTPPGGLWPDGTYWHLATRPDELAATPHFMQLAPAIDQRLRSARFRTLVHGDAKPDNFCFAPAGEVAALDFQYVGGGIGVQDVVYLLSGSDVCERAPMNEALTLYFSRLRAELTQRSSRADVSALEAEWRALVPWALADFHRFLAGWSPELAQHDALGRAALDEVASLLRRRG
jgi:hypothetical protein